MERETAIFEYMNTAIENVAFLLPLKTSENYWFPDISRAYSNGKLD